MNEIQRQALVAPGALRPGFDLTPKQLSLIADMNRDLNRREFDQFIETSRALGLNPLARQVSAIVFNKHKADKRQMAIVTTIMGYRAIADRTGTYRPDDKPARFTYDEGLVGPTNPQGLIDCIVTPYRYAHGEWFPIVGQVWWDEIAPVYKGRDGDPDRLDGKTPWPKRPRGQLAKCAEAAALRQGWPENFANTYIEDELDRSKMIDVTPSEAAEGARKEELLEQAGTAKGTIIIDLDDGKGLTSLPVGSFHDTVSRFFAEHGKEEPASVLTWVERNRLAFRAFYAHDKAAAMDLKRQIEAMQASLREDDSEGEAEAEAEQPYDDRPPDDYRGARDGGER